MVFWLSLAAWLVLSAAGIGFATARGIALWRSFKRTGGDLGSELGKIAESADKIQTHLDRAEAAGSRLKDVSARLGRSRARLDVLLSAIREARAAVMQAWPLASPPKR